MWNWIPKEGMKSHDGGNVNSIGGGRDFKILPYGNLDIYKYTLQHSFLLLYLKKNAASISM